MKLESKLTKILLIDDSLDDNYLHKLVLEEMNVSNEIDVVNDGEQAIEYLTCKGRYESSAPNFPCPELIFLDINMPKMNGWEFLECYKDLPVQQKGGPIIVMLSTSANPEDRDKAEQFSAIGKFVNKPLTEDLVEAVIQEFFPEKVAASD
jgi:CheY-like chemotaxis protein